MRGIVLLCLLFTTFFSYSQELDSKLLKFPRYALGYSPSAHISLYSAHQMSHDVGIMDNINLTLETGYIHHSIYNQYTTGYKIRGGVEFLLYSKERTGFFIGAHFLHRNTNTPTDFTVFHQDGNFSETIEFERYKKIIAGELKLGFLVEFTNRIRGELSLGAGSGNVTTVDSDKTFSRSEEEFFFVFNDTVIRERYVNGQRIFGTFNLNFSYTLFK